MEPQPDRRKNSSTIFVKVAYGVIGIAIALLLYMSYLIFYPASVLEVKEIPLPAHPTEVKPGEVVTTTFNYCKHRDLASRITLDFEGEFLVPQLSTVQHFPVGCHVRKLPFVVPTSAPAGEYRILMTVTYKTNPLNVKTYEFYSAPITVIKE